MVRGAAAQPHAAPPPLRGSRRVRAPRALRRSGPATRAHTWTRRLAALTEFLCARHPRRVRAAKKKWEIMNDESLVDRLSDELAGDMRTVALTLLKGKRAVDDANDDEGADDALAATQVQQLTDDPSSGIAILCANSTAQNAAIAKLYEEKNDKSLGRALGEVRPCESDTRAIGRAPRRRAPRRRRPHV